MVSCKKIGFDGKVCRILKRIPRGKVSTYGEVARALGSRACRAVGNALGRNKDPDKIPCFKVVKSDGSLGGFSRGAKDKIRRLKKEGIKVRKGKIANFKKVFFRLS